MASEYTPNYHLDLYTDNDKPNLRDQYNAAMRKIDRELAELHSLVTSIQAVQACEGSKGE